MPKASHPLPNRLARTHAIVLMLALATPRAAASAPAPAPAPAHRAPPVMPPLGKKEGRVFAEKPGGTVTLTTPAKKLSLLDGEKVTFLQEIAGVGMGTDAEAEVMARGQKGRLPNARVITEERLHRAPDNSLAIFSALYACGDVCHGEVWLLGPSSRRQRLTTEAPPRIEVAHSPDGQLIAVGATELYLISRVDWKVEKFAMYTAPAYAPDGALIVRGPDDQVSEMKGKTFQTLVTGPPQVPREDGDYGSEPSSVSFAADGKTFEVLFWRGSTGYIWTVARDGKVLARKKRF